MSMDSWEYEYDQAMSDLYEEHKVEAINEFTSERLSSYYSENSNLAKPAINALNEASSLSGNHPTASLILAAISMEVALKTTFLKPIIYGLVHTESVATLVTDLTISHSGMDRYRNLLFKLLKDHAKIDFEKFKRDGSSTFLWEEIGTVQKARNIIMHRAETAKSADSQLAICVAEALLETIFPQLLKEMGFHLHDDYRICSDWTCRYEGTPMGDIIKNTKQPQIKAK